MVVCSRSLWPNSIWMLRRSAPCSSGCVAKQWRLCRMRHSRHTFATTMLRLGVSLPALMQLLGHKDIHMTLRYLDVTQQDLRREFHCARQKAASLHPIPKLPLPQTTTPERVDLPAIRNAIAVVRHLLQLFRLELQDPNAR